VDSSMEGKVALVAGGTGGLGRAVSLAFLEAGASLVVTYLQDQEFDRLKSGAGSSTGRLAGQKVDVTDEQAVRRLMEGIVAGYGRLDILVNTVGGYAGGMKLWESDTKLLDRMLTLNLRSGFVLSGAAVKVMLKQGPGAIINVSGQAGITHPAGLGAYAASKAAAIAMINSLASDLKGTGIRVNSILPGVIDTEANRKAMPDADFSAWTTPEAIARVILFLGSRDGQAVHGAAIPV
jgi:NAD(P)-dependent dehydrogenase (short-subunit alcohol dehydrogenase family)